MTPFNLVECSSEDRKYISEGINKYNLGHSPAIIKEKWIRFDYAVKNERQEIIAGIIAILGYWGGLEIDILWVTDDLRRSGIGTKLLKEIEKKAKEKGAVISLLDTFDFQAKDFYLKNGYTIFGQVDNYPLGHKKYYLQKRL